MEIIDSLYGGIGRFVTDGILGAPRKDFLMELSPGRTLDDIFS